MSEIPMKDEIYLKEILEQCNYAFEALSSMYISYNEDLTKFFYHVQMFLSSTANVNKLLNNNSNDKYKEHQSRIKETYEIPDIDFDTERRIRNSLEHIDEKLVDWIMKSKSHNLANRNLMPKSAISGEVDFFINFDPTNNVLSFGDLEIDTEETFNKLKQLSLQIEEILSLF